MTKENVIKIIRHVFHYYDEQHADYNWSEFNEACGIVMDLLENNKIIDELEKIKAEIKQMPNESWNDCDTVDRKELLYRIDKRIAELKGE